MKRWIVLVALLCVGAAVLTLPPRSWIRMRTPERRRVNEIKAEIRHQDQLLRDLGQADSVAALVRQARAAGQFLVVRLGPDASPAQGDTIRRVLLSDAGVPATDMVSGLLVLPRRDGVAVVPRTKYPLARYFIGSDPVPHCIAVSEYARGVGSRPLTTGLVRWARDGTLFGPCRFFARYGEPGRRIGTWLDERDGYRFALDPAHPVTAPQSRPPGLLGAAMLYGTLPGAPDERCLAGNTGECRRAFLGLDDAASPERDTTVDDPALYPSTARLSFADFDHLAGSMLSDLDAEFGSARFARFWHSDTDVETAFQAAFGEPVGEWVMRWGRQRLEPLDPGSLNAPGHLAETLATFALAILLAVAIARRRQVG